MTGHAADGRNDGAIAVFIHLKEFLVDLTGHLVHITGHVLLGFGITGEIEMMRCAIRRRRMTKTTFYAQCRLPTVHGLYQILMTDVLWQDLQILGTVFRWAGGGHSDDRQGGDGDDDGDFLVMQHKGDFGSVS